MYLKYCACHVGQASGSMLCLLNGDPHKVKSAKEMAEQCHQFAILVPGFEAHLNALNATSGYDGIDELAKTKNPHLLLARLVLMRRSGKQDVMVTSTCTAEVKMRI